jgi:hypothetical protein
MNNPWELINCPNHEANVRRVDPKHPFDLFWGKDIHDKYLFIFETLGLSYKSDISIELQGIDIIWGKKSNGEISRFILRLKDNAEWELFLGICNDLVAVTANSLNLESAVAAIQNRLARWQRFLKNNNHLLSDEQIRGLIGELLFLKHYLFPVYGSGHSIKFWKGPEGFPQDFDIGTCAVEVKSRLADTNSCITVSSAEQLYSQQNELYLHIISLKKADGEHKGSFTLNGLVSELHEALASDFQALDRFTNLLFEVGYYEADRYSEQSYLCGGEQIYQVIDGFPRIIPIDIPCGVKRVSYAIDISTCDEFKVEHYRFGEQL